MDSDIMQDRARYRQVADDLRARVRAGAFAPDGRLPSEVTLARELGVSRGTVRQALAVLLSERAVHTVPGRGTFVTSVSGGTGTADRETAGYGAPESVVSARAEPRDDYSSGQRAGNRLVGVVIPEVARMRVPELLGGIEAGLRAADYSLVLGGSGDWREQEAEQVDRLVRQGVQGLILYPVDGASNAALLRELRAGGLPVVLVDRYLFDLNVDAVVADNIGGACQAVQHLVRAGRQRIGFVSTDNLGTSSIAERRAGYLLALEQLAVVGGHSSVEGPSCTSLHRLFTWPAPDQTAARRNGVALAQYLGRPDRPDAVFAVNDMVAFQVLEAAAGLGLRVPDDLAVVGFDNLAYPDYAGVPLTTIEQPREAIGRVAAGLVIDGIAGRRTETARVVLATRLIVRQTSVAHPSEHRVPVRAGAGGTRQEPREQGRSQ